MDWNKTWQRVQLAAGLGAGVLVGRVGALASALTYAMIYGYRQPLWRTPAELGMPFEEVSFRASDGVQLAGWLIKRANDDGSPAPALVFVHGWPWNRLGNRAGLAAFPDQTVSFLEPAHALHQAGYHVLLIDLRNHGASQAAPPVTFGVHEARDVAGAVEWLRTQPQVDGSRIGLIGFSMGANSVLYGLPACRPIRAAMVIQPVKIATFGRNFARDLLGPLGPTLFQLAEPIHRLVGGPPLSTIDPTSVVGLIDDTPIMYVQGSHDPWGSHAEVQAMAAATPRALPVITTPAQDRYQGYLYVQQHCDEVVNFFRTHFA